MAGRVRYLLNREGRYYARVAVPARLRKIIGKRELLEPLGADRRTALKSLPAVVAVLLLELDTARARIRPHARRGEAAAAAPSPLPTQPVNFRIRYRRTLVGITSGRATEAQAGTAVGWAVDSLKAQGVIACDKGSTEWNNAMRALAGIQLEFLRRMEGHFPGEDGNAPAAPPPARKLRRQRASNSGNG